MILTLNNLAKTYGLLPSEAFARADTFDLHVLDVATRWEIHQRDKQNKIAEGKSKQPSQAELMAMIKRVKERPVGQ